MKLRASLWIGGVSVIYWIAFYTIVFQDLYYTSPTVGFFLKVLGPPILLANIVCVILSLASRARMKRLALLAATLNALPVLVAAWFLWWLFFGVKI